MKVLKLDNKEKGVLQLEEMLSMEISIMIAHNLRKIRKNKKMTQSEVAELANITRVTYSRLETARGVVSLQTLLKLAIALNVTVDELLTGVLDAMRSKN